MKAIICLDFISSRRATRSLSLPPISAKGRLKGAVIGGVAGHLLVTTGSSGRCRLRDRPS
jgi:hypothetical protein